MEQMAIIQGLLGVAFLGLFIKGCIKAKRTGVSWTKIGDPSCDTVYVGLGVSSIFLGALLQSLHLPGRGYLSGIGCLVLGIHYMTSYKKSTGRRELMYGSVFIGTAIAFIVAEALVH